MSDTGAPVLEVTGLSVRFRTQGRETSIVRGVDLAVNPAECIGLIGESGSGKSVTGLAIAQLLPSNAIVTAECMRVLGMTLQEWSARGRDRLHGTGVSMIFQDPVGAFNPSKTVGWHLMRCIQRRRRRNGDAVPATTLDDAVAYLDQVEITSPRRVAQSYPHQLSGGMVQRALIAMTLALEPGLIIADEATTNLDKPVEGQILGLLTRLQQRLHAGMIFITHDLLVAKTMCARINVMYAGEIVESGVTADVLERPAHPYTIALLETSTSLERGDAMLAEIRGESRRDGVATLGCAFAPRCLRALAECHTASPPVVQLAGGQAVRCWLAAEKLDAVASPHATAT